MRVRRLATVLSLLTACTLAACGGSSSSTSTHSAAASNTTTTSATSTASTAQAASQTLGPEAIPLEAGPSVAPASSTTSTNGATVDGIQCAPVEQLAYHIHAHLQVYVNGQSRALPAAIGMLGPVAQQTAYGPFYGAQQCIYWLHTHASDGVIHIESPTKRIYTLGNFFDEWHQPLSPTQVATATGKVTAFLNGKAWKRDPRTIPLLPHASVQLDVGSPVVGGKVISFAHSNL